MSDNLPQTIGIDISKASLDCHVHPIGSKQQFANTAKGHKALIAWLRQWPIERIADEATAPCHRALERALADWPCVKLNPERARRFAQATGTLAKTDRIDAMLLARMAATLQPPDTTLTSRPSTSNSSQLENPQKSPSQPSCASSSSPQTPCSKPIDAGRNLWLDHHGYSKVSALFD